MYVHSYHSENIVIVDGYYYKLETQILSCNINELTIRSNVCVGFHA